MVKDSKRKEIYDILIIIISMIFSYVFLLNSPSHPWINSEAPTDSAVFKTIALMMKNGYMPYKDSFDHKGPLIYILNYLGNEINLINGNIYIEMIFIAFTIFVIYKIGTMFVKSIYSLSLIMFIGSMLFKYFNKGNYTEEYAMLFISIALYIFTDYFINKRISKLRLILCGFSFGCVLMLRPNMIAVWVVMCLNVLYKELKDKNYKELGYFLLWFIIGTLLVILPLLVWLGVNGALVDFYKDYILFNVRYSSDSGTDKWINTFGVFLTEPVFLSAFTCNAILIFIDKSKYNIIHIEGMLMSLLLTCMSGKYYGHYGMVLIPVTIYPLSRTVQIFICKNSIKGKK